MNKYYYSDIIDHATKLKSDTSGYSVISNKMFSSGEIIEECPVKKIKSNLDNFYTEDSDPDEILLNGLIGSHNIDTNKIDLYMVGGNYLVYNTSDDYNAIYQFDPRFDVVTIRAVKKIDRGEEINLPLSRIEESTKQEPEMTKKKPGGCGCGKNKNKTSRPKKILNDAPTEYEQKELKDKFKSMVDGQDLKRIKVESKTDSDYIR